MSLGPVDIEGALIGVVAAPASTRIPNPRPAAFTRITRAGGTDLNVVMSRPRVLVECFAGSSTAAFERAAEAYAAIRDLLRTTAGGVWFAEVELTEPVNFPDDATGMARYQFVAQLTTSLREMA